MPNVSVIVPAWNAADTIADAIGSALAQDGVGVEVIVADDASTDATRDAIAAIGDSRIIYHRLAENAGPGAARNAAIKRASGRWIAVLDADDAMKPGRLARMIAAAEAAGAAVAVDNLIVEDPALPPAPMFAPQLFAGGLLPLAAFIEGNTPLRTQFNLGYLKPLVSRAFLDRHAIRYDESLRVGEDFIFIADCLAAGGICVMAGRAGYRYRVRAGSASHRLGLRQIEAMIAADRALEQRWPLGARERAAVARRARALRAVRAFTAAVEAIKTRKWWSALRLLAGNPRALIHFRHPIGARIARMRGRRIAG